MSARVVVKDKCLEFRCPGCGRIHDPNLVRLPKRGREIAPWSWNGSLERPTLAPAMKFTVRDKHHRVTMVCHFFLRLGRIQFLGDSTHALAGKTVTLAEIDD